MDMTNDRAKSIFGNEIDERTYKSACASKRRYERMFGHDGPCPLDVEEPPVIGRLLGVRNLVPASEGAKAFDIYADAAAAPAAPVTERTVEGADGAPVIVGNIRMGFGHYRIAMAFASAARAMGYTPYWLDLCGFPKTLATKVIKQQNGLYSLGSRLSQKVGLFNRLVWDPLNSEGFKKLTYNASDQKVSELYTAPLSELPRDVPFIGTHAWPSQAAIHAGFTHVVNAIPDNWPMALHLAEGSVHIVQTPFAYGGYKTLSGMDPKRTLKPMPDGSLVETGHYIDHELVANIEADCARRVARREADEPVRYLLTVGGAGAQRDLFIAIVAHILPLVRRGRASLCINVGDHKGVWDALVAAAPSLKSATCHFGDFDEVAQFATEALDGPIEGVHAFYDEDIFGAVYSTNLLMRACDVLITKPSELAYYPVPKLMIQHVGGHEVYGAIRAAEVGDGTPELARIEQVRVAINRMQGDRGWLVRMCDAIRTANEQGVYDGAYKGVEIAVRGSAR